MPRSKRPSIWLLPVLLLVVLSLLPLAYAELKTWQAGWSEALHLLWRPYVFGLLRNTLELMVGVTVACGVIGLSLAWLLERSNLPGRRLWGVILCLPFAVPALVSSFTWVSLSAHFEGLGGAILVMLSAVLLALCLMLLWLELRVRGKGRHVRTGQGAARQAEQVRLGPWAVAG